MTEKKKKKKKEKNGVFSGHYVIAGSLLPERLRPNDDRRNAARSCQLQNISLNNLFVPEILSSPD